MLHRFPKTYIVFLILPLLLSSCSNVTGITPETLVISSLLNAKSRVDPFTIQIQQKQPLKDHIFLLAGYQMDRSEKEVQVCQSLYDIYRDQNHFWTSQGAHTGCSSESLLNPSFRGTGGGIATLAAEENSVLYSYLFGTASEDAISVTVIWSDGVNQTVSVNKRVYLAVREGSVQYLQVIGKDPTGKVVYTEAFPQ